MKKNILTQDNWYKLRPAVTKLLGLKAKTVYIPMYDGIKLTATLYTPKEGTSWPVVVQRNPYVIGDVSALAIYWKKFTENGYAVLDVQVRGSQKSEGEFLPMKNEREDGKATIDWVGEQDWCNGNIGTFGASYVGYTQWAILDYDHPMLKTHFVSMFGNDPQQMYWRRGMFRQEVSTMWGAQMAGDHRFQMWLGKGADEMYRKAYDIRPQVELGEQLTGEPCDWYADWVTTPDPKDPYWDTGAFGDVRRLAKDVKRPVCFHGGWYDIFNRMQLQGYRALPKSVREKSQIIIGPWEHHGFTGGELKFNEGDKYGTAGIDAAVAWFDHQLKGEPLKGEYGMDAYCIGEGKWHHMSDDLAPSSKLRFYLAEGKLEEKKGKQGTVSYRYDPKDPVASLGGNMIYDNNNGGTAGPCSQEQLKPGTRDDIITFLSPKLKKSRTICGTMDVDLYVSSSAPATAFTVKVSEVFPNGKAYNIRDDITDIRFVDETTIKDYEPGSVRKLTFCISDVYWKLQKGSKLRVDISSSNFPAYHVHPNTTTVFGLATKEEEQVADQTIYFGGKTPSSITISME